MNRLMVNDAELESIRKEIDICICVDETLVLECTSDDQDAQLALSSEDATMYENGTARIMVTLDNLGAANHTFICTVTSALGPCGVFEVHTVYGKFHQCHKLFCILYCSGCNSAPGYLNIMHDFVRHGRFFI